jgi:hypothetical protein
MKRLVAEVVDDLISGVSLKRCRLRQAYGQAKEALNRRSDPRRLICDLEPLRRPVPLVQNSNFVEKIFREYLVTKLKGGL